MTATPGSIPAAAPATEPAGGGLNRKALALGLLVTLPLLGILVANLGRDPHSVRSPLLGQAAPPFALPTVDGTQMVSLESLKGRPAVINFWATWCVPCYQEHPALNSAAQAMQGEVQFLGMVYEDEPARVQAFLQERGNAYPSLLDEGGRTAIAYGVYGVPETYFVDAAGRIVEKFVGPLDAESIARLVAKAKAATQ